jgi:hypothetical protein
LNWLRGFLVQFGRLLRGAGRRAVGYAKVASVLSVKAAIDVVINHDRPWISFENVAHDNPGYIFLLIALSRVGPIGCSPRDSYYRAWRWMPVRDFLRTVRVNWRAPTDGILLSETKHGPGILHVNPQYYSSPPAKHRLFAPYFAHPKFYRAGLHNVVRDMRGQDRNVRIFFAGSIGPSYSEHFKFPILSRSEIFRHVTANFEWAINTEVDMSGIKPILIVSRNDGIRKYKLSMLNYIEVMSRSDFFICPPGLEMPQCHNLIEAMSVGTIPITNYHLYMRPSLTPDANCLAFSTLEELKIAVSRALSMDAAEIQRLREGVISYFDDHLEPARFAKKLMERQATISEIVINDGSCTS